MKNIIVSLSIIALFAACGGKTQNKLELKRAELDSLQSEMTNLKAAIASVQEDIKELDTSARANAIAVMATEITKGAFRNPFQVQGLIESDQNVMVSPEVPAKITRILVKEGQRVIKGQVIATLDGSTASSQIAELEGALSLAKINYEKQKRLWKQNIGSEMQYLQAKNQYENLQNSITTARTQLGKYSLRSPISGTVDELMANEGELVGGMTSGPVARVVNLKDIKIKANVSEKYLGKIKKGQTVDVEFPSLGIKMTEKISSVSNVIDVNNRTFVVYVKPSKNLSKLRPNLLSMITAYDFEDSDAISVPTKLVRTDGEKYFVYTIATNGSKKTVEKRFIEIEQQFPSETVVKSGLAPGDLLITEGVNSVIVGDEIKIVKE
ncbi:MAG: efflux RND transporter periplasmic adaptor subunit [Bacteroidetes bacterium]|jgi:membrane fusion protein (multidrug efflux system)|nr:efflux RND transporter periplasmic adaptor subunit [Bacteroidota bacterium]